jgi:hypothetical protein
MAGVINGRYGTTCGSRQNGKPIGLRLLDAQRTTVFAFLTIGKWALEADLNRGVPTIGVDLVRALT